MNNLLCAKIIVAFVHFQYEKNVQINTDQIHQWKTSHML